MAVTEIHPITTFLNKALDYIENPDKTEGKMLCTGYGCVPETAYYQFNQIKEKAIKNDGYLAFHLIQSFAPGETDKDTAHQIGIELADKLLKGKFQYVVSTHIDKGHLHNHILINSVSFKDFSKYNSSPSSYYFIRRASDTLCKEHGLSVITPTKNKGKEYNEYVADKQSTSWKTQLRKNIDRCIMQTQDWDEFLVLTLLGSSLILILILHQVKQVPIVKILIECLLDCNAHKIDIVLTKSINRFGRDTLEILSALEQLRETNTRVIFETEEIDTEKTDSRLMISVLESFAQAENESRSDNIKWGNKQCPRHENRGIRRMVSQ